MSAKVVTVEGAAGDDLEALDTRTFELEQIHDNCREHEVNLVLQLYILFHSCYARLLRV